MKKQFISILAALMTISFVISGCSLSKDDSIQSTEYITDKADEDASVSNDTAADGQSIIVAENLFEPVLEALETAQEEQTEEKSVQRPPKS